MKRYRHTPLVYGVVCDTPRKILIPDESVFNNYTISKMCDVKTSKVLLTLKTRKEKEKKNKLKIYLKKNLITIEKKKIIMRKFR